MNKLWKLTKVMLKTSFASTQLKVSKKPWLNYLFLAIVLVALLPSFGLYYYGADNLIKLLQPLNQQAIVVNLVVALNSVLIFVMSLLFLPTIYFFSKDVELYLPFPIKPYEIISGKFLVALMMEYLILLFSYVPPMLAYLMNDFSLFLLMGFILLFILLPILPLILASLFVMIGTRFLPFMKNKNFMTITLGALSLVLALAFSLGLQNMSFVDDPNQLLDLVLSGGINLASFMFTYLPPVKFVADFIVNQNFFALLLFAVVVALSYGLLLVVSNQIYFTTVTSIQESKTTTRKVELSRQNKQVKSLAYFKKELLILFRTPAYLMNNVLGAFIIPFFMIVPLFLSDQSESTEIFSLLRQLELPLRLALPIGLLLGMGLAIFNSGSNMIAATAISRDKHQINANLSMPFAYNQQLIVKAAVGSFMSLIVSYLILLILLLFSPNLWLLVVSALIPCLIVTYVINLLSVYIDALFPKLRWQNEQEAVKNNFNGVIALFGSWTILGGLIALYFLLTPPLLLFSVFILLVFILIGFLIQQLIKRQETSLKEKLV